MSKNGVEGREKHVSQVPTHCSQKMVFASFITFHETAGCMKPGQFSSNQCSMYVFLFEDNGETFQLRDSGVKKKGFKCIDLSDTYY